MTRDSATNVALFCGGRGSAAMIRELSKRQDVNLTLLVNAYDDGLSTGALRNFIPGMLGPSDFRKNLSYLVDPHSPEQYALQALLEYRLPVEFAEESNRALERLIETGSVGDFPKPVHDIFAVLSRTKGDRLRELLASFYAYARGKHFDYADCSFGNLLFAGAFLQNGKRFNIAITELSKLFDSRAQLVNVSAGENRTLCALKWDGQLLRTEADVVGEQSAVPISDIYLLERPVGEGEWGSIAGGTLEEKRRWLSARELKVECSAEATVALAEADVVIFGSGTQHSSLLPSYKITRDAVAQSRAAIKAIIVNLDHDHDIAGLQVRHIIENALRYLGDADNRSRVITHALVDRNTTLQASAGDNTEAFGGIPGVRVIVDDFRSPGKRSIHSGSAIASTLLRLLKVGLAPGEKAAVDIYIDLLERSVEVRAMLQDVADIDWEAAFAATTLHIARFPGNHEDARSAVRIVPFRQNAGDEGRIVSQWLSDDCSPYLATITGDGHYDLEDILLAVRVLEEGGFGAIFGSRTQSRRQFQGSLRAAYGEGNVLYAASGLAAFVLSALFAMRFGIIFSDPLTGFRVYRRTALEAVKGELLTSSRPRPFVDVLKAMTRVGIEIAEVPVRYRTFSGFTNPGWRVRRGLAALWGVLLP